MPTWDDDDDFDEDPVDADDEDEPTDPCPACGAPVYEEADACPHCGEYLSFDAPHAGGHAWWIWLGAILGLIAMLSGVVWMIMVVLS